MKKIFLGLMACAALCACTSDDLVSLGNETQKVFEGDVAYMTVRLKDVGAGTRATSPTTDGGFGTATEAEYAVKDAYFYFYDDEGVFVSEAEVWDGGTANSTNTNIDFDGNTVIILKGLTQKKYPNYVVTVLNKPTSFKPGETLTEMASLLANATDVLYTSGTGSTSTTNYFVMSTSSYVATTTSGGDTTTPPAFSYFATPIAEDDFYTEPIEEWGEDADGNKRTPVDIYVERLAAKAMVSVSSEMQASSVKYTEGEEPSTVEYSTYVIKETIAGDENASGTGEDMGTADIYVAFLGWTTNAVARNSYMMKNINTAWTNEGSGTDDLGKDWTWNDATNHRSYWGMSWNYGDATVEYPTESKGNTDADENGTSTSTGEKEPLNKYLLYKSLQTTTALGSDACEYFGENTNTADILGSKYSSGITHVLLKAVACDAKGTPLDLVRYNGMLFTTEAYLNYVMSYLTATGKLNVYVQNEDDETYSHIDGSYIKLSSTYGTEPVTLTDGLVAVVVDEDAFSEKTFYKYENGNYSEITSSPGPDAATTVTTALDAFNATAEANAYKDGLMYYSIPIEHLNNTYPDEETLQEGDPSINEANYGVVRNHWYSLTINSLSNMGHGIFDPEEVIVPNTKEEPTYYVGADINILSWKLVDQNVSLK